MGEHGISATGRICAKRTTEDASLAICYRFPKPARRLLRICGKNYLPGRGLAFELLNAAANGRRYWVALRSAAGARFEGGRDAFYFRCKEM
jgi:hypothetical protein